MAKDAKETQKKNSNKNNLKESNKKVVKKVNVEEKKDDKKKVNSKPIKKVVEEEIIKEEPLKKVEKVKKDKEALKEERKDKMGDFLGKINSDNVWKSALIFVGGFLVATFLFRCILWPDRIAKLENGEEPIATIDNENITANMLYNDMKESYSIDSLLKFRRMPF